MGKSRDAQWEQELRARYANLPNLEITGFIDQFSSPRYAEVLERSWIIVNSATREALPNAFLEAASYQCAILSSVDPDGFVSKFGYHAQNDDFADGLELLLKDENWKVRGQRGYDYVKHTFELERAIDWHLDTYRCLLSA